MDLIFEGLLHFGRSATDYSATGAIAVSVKLFGGKVHLAFLENGLIQVHTATFQAGSTTELGPRHRLRIAHAGAGSRLRSAG